MNKQFQRICAKGCVLIFGIAMIAGCASRPEIKASRVAVRRIAIISVASPRVVELDRSGLLPALAAGGIGAVVNHFDVQDKSAKFDARMTQLRNELGGAMTAGLLRELRSSGFDAFVLTDVPRPADDPDDIDYATLHPDADAILHVWITNVGVYAGWGDYLPRLNVTVKLISSADQSELYSDYLYYGVEAKNKQKYWAVPSDPKYAFPSFKDLMNRADDAAEGLHAGAEALARRIAEELKGKL